MIKFKKGITLGLTILLLTQSTTMALASTQDNSGNPIQVNYNEPAEKVIANIDEGVIDKAKTEAILKQYIENGYIQPEYAEKVMKIVDKYSVQESSQESNSLARAGRYYNESTGALIYNINNTNIPGQRKLIFNKAGWNIIKEIINLGGGSVTIGFAVAALMGVAITGGIAGLLGGAIVVANAAVNLQFSLGYELAFLPY